MRVRQNLTWGMRVMGVAVLLLLLGASRAAAQTAALSDLVVASLSPSFSPAIKTYSIPRTSACSVPVTATLANTAHRMYVASMETTSGTTRNAWVCDGRTKVDIVLYAGWTEVARYTVNVVTGAPAPTPPPAPPAPPAPPVPSVEPAPVPSPVPVFNDPLPAPAPVSQQVARRLLSQATFGPTALDMAAVQANGIDYWLTQQFQLPQSQVANGLDSNAVRAKLFLNMATGPDQLRQRVMFALGQTLVVSAGKNVNGYELIPWVRLLSDHAFGNYRTLLREVTLSPAMGKFLDLANSTGGMSMVAPNENYPRELLQLFSIGIWNLKQDGTFLTAAGQPVSAYNQTTITEVARALSGWTYPTAPGAQSRSHNPEYFVGLMEPRPGNHDRGAKTILGTTIPANQSVTDDLEDVIDIVFAHPNVPPFVATRLIRSLVTSNPSAAYIKRVADTFADNGQGVRGDLKAVVTAVLTDPDAALPGLTGGRLLDPVLHVIGLGRALGAQFGDASQFMYVFSNLGQAPLNPPSVFSFYSPLAPLPGDPTLFGPEFMIYSPALAVHRANFAYGLLSGQFSSSFSINLAPFVAVAGNPQVLVELVNQRLLQGGMSPELFALLVTSAQAVTDPTQRALGALYLTAISSEFIVHTGA